MLAGGRRGFVVLVLVEADQESSGSPASRTCLIYLPNGVPEKPSQDTISYSFTYTLHDGPWYRFTHNVNISAW
ncbi:hypothetical protein ACLMAL_38635 [Nocardia sp. CWNU-33]|uniref:hypothetical protein n=1 Tax=Nocardia sp. CWNU-33 TaxID=3392117 RepID=UPI00398F7B61